MPTFNLPDEPNRFVVLAVSRAVPQGVALAQTDLVEYAVLVGHGALSSFRLPQDRGTRVIIRDRAKDLTIHAGMLDSTGQPTWDGRPIVGGA